MLLSLANICLLVKLCFSGAGFVSTLCLKMMTRDLLDVEKIGGDNKQD